MKKNTKRYLVYFYCFSIFGFIWECIINYFTEKNFVKPGVLFGPWLPIYGIGILMIIILSKKIKNKYILSIISFILIGILEYSTGVLLENLFHKKYWDFSKLPLNINGRVCFFTTLGFTIGAFLAIKYIIPLIDKLEKRIDNLKLNITLIIISIIFIIDYIFSIINNLIR